MKKLLSSNTEEVAELPFQIDIQLFADEDIDDSQEDNSDYAPFSDMGDTNDLEAEEDTDSEDDIDEEDKGTDEEEPDEAGKQEVADPEQEKPKQDPDTNKAFQEMRHKLREKETALERAARVSGFDKVEDYLAEVERVERENEAQRYQEAANDPEKLKQLIEENPAIKEAKRIQFENQIAKQKEVFKEKRFFKQLEPEIDNLLKTIPNVDVRTAYNYLVGEKLDELLEKEKQSVKKSTIADIADKSKRSAGNVSSDGGGDDVDISNIDIDMARAFGNDPKEIAKYKKQNMKRR